MTSEEYQIRVDLHIVLYITPHKLFDLNGALFGIIMRTYVLLAEVSNDVALIPSLNVFPNPWHVEYSRGRGLNLRSTSKAALDPKD